ncbi:MAG TPA: hypothetical protein VHH12_06460, partial [Mycobacterium sp.]|nr:hypothetical protein [Mycobacterium sp.]
VTTFLPGYSLAANVAKDLAEVKNLLPAGAVLLTRAMPGTAVPMESSFVAIFLGGAVTALMAMVLIALSRPTTRPIDSVEAQCETRAMNHEWG